MQRSETGLFVPFRACGLICSEIPPVYQPMVNKPIKGELSCIIENVVCVYSIKPFRLKMIVPNLLKENVSLIACSSKFLFAAVQKTIFVYEVRKEKVYKMFSINNTPKLLLACGESGFTVVDDENQIIVYDLKRDTCVNEIESPKSFNATVIVHPMAYANKVVLGGEDGRMRLVDLVKGCLVREFPADKNFNCKITVLEQSPAIDVLAVGMVDGRIHLRNIKADRVLFSFRHEGSITALSFRTDGVDSLVSGSTDGSIAVWDLEKQILVGQKSDAHAGPIVSLNFLVGEPFLISSGTDNRLVKWRLKDEISLPEEIKVIEGPSEPVSAISFTGSRSLLLASKDGCMRQFHAFYQDNSLKRMGLAREVKRGELSKNRFIDVRLSSIVEMQMIHARESVWDNVICRHENSPLISTWSTRRFTRGSLLLYHKRFQSNPRYLAAHATSIFLSSCGTFALVGSSSGHLDVFNMQSGKHRCSFHYSSNPEQKIEDDDDLVAHSSAVTGVALDMLNRIVVSGAADSFIHFWSFNPPRILARVSNSECGSVEKFQLNRFNSLLAVAFANGDVVIVDVLCQRIARHFKHAHTGKITALEFSADGKWLISTDNQCMIKVWDLSTSNLIDALRCPLPCIGVSFNETGEFLATIHEDRRAIYVWANKMLFMPNFSGNFHVSEEVNCCPQISQLPTISVGTENSERNTKTKLESENDDNHDDSDDEDDIGQIVVIDDDEDNYSTLNLDDTLIDTTSNSEASNFITLSGLAVSRWANLPILDLIRDRNKPIEPPKKPESAPFFLPGTESLEGFTFDKIAENGVEKMDVDNKENIVEVLMAKRTIDMDMGTPWTKSLMSAEHGDDSSAFLTVFESLKSMNISAIDFQIRSLTSNVFCSFLKMLLIVLEQRKDFELVQSYFATFLNIHREALWVVEENQDVKVEEDENDAIVSNKSEDELTEIFEKLLSLQQSTWSEMQSLIDSNISLTQWIKSSLI